MFSLLLPPRAQPDAKVATLGLRPKNGEFKKLLPNPDEPES
jgi:hypothetical protein